MVCLHCHQIGKMKFEKAQNQKIREVKRWNDGGGSALSSNQSCHHWPCPPPHPPNPPHPTIWLPPSLDKSDAARSPNRQYNGIPNFLWHLSIRNLRYCCSTYNVKVSLSCKVHWWHFLLLEKAQAKGKSRDNNLFASFGQIAFPAFGQIWSKILFKRYNRFHQSQPWPWIK